MEIKKILCPVDFSENSEKALDYAVFLASAHQAEIVLLHVVDGPTGFDKYQILALTPQEIAEKLEVQARDKLDDLAEAIAENVKVEATLSHGKAFVEIIKEARGKEADLIVMGSHGRTGIPHMLIGSVAEKVVRKAPCPVLVVRDEKVEFEMP